MKPIVRVENLSKQYSIGARQAHYDTLRESVMAAVRAPLKRFRRNGNSDANTIWALKDVNFEVMPGEVVGIIGRNGAGKSTLLKILSRITEPTIGEVDLYGRVASLLEVGTGFHPELTGRENIYLNGAILGMQRVEIERKFDEIIAFADVETFVDTPVKHYSSGMYLRLAFAVAAHLEPEIFLVDEVLAVGDASFQKKCLGKMSDVAREGRTVLFVSHNMAAIQQLCGRAFLFGSGRIHQEGPPETVIANYLSDASQSEDGDFDLSDHPARSAQHHSVIRQLRLYREDGSPTTQYYPDDAMVVEVVIEPDAPIKGPRVALAIEDSLGRRITTIASFFQNQPTADIERPCRFRCTLPRLGLGSGRYLISVSIADKYSGMLDGLHNAVWFEVFWQNNYGNGEPYHSYYGPVLTRSVWTRVDY
jgi:homopolymeric O-antigen transport system ATP-binding protein